MPITLSTCQALDREDPLRHLRERFEPARDGAIHLDANSLGPMPAGIADEIAQRMRDEWAGLRRRAWSQADWLGSPQRIGAALAPILGAEPDDLIAADNTTIDLYKLLTYALSLADGETGKRVIVLEREGFPTDCHVAQGVARASKGRWELRTIDGEAELAQALRNDVAVVMLSHADYRSGWRWDMAAVNRQAHAVGARVLWDLSHTAGALPVRLRETEADFAVACGYKYLCGGPGAPALAYIHPALRDRGWPTIPGWLGHADPMTFPCAYEPGPGMASLINGTPPILQNLILEAAARIWSEVPPQALAWKHRSLSETLVTLLEQECAEFGVRVASPPDYAQRGGHVTFTHEGGGALCEALLEAGVVGSFRNPDVIRLGLSPLVLSHADLWEAVARLRRLLANEGWRAERFRNFTL
ncbi:MAG: aminotransferase class V-fold PLP-dependent enzyme [Burkholderiales bacterium]|nr:aminotransferase class V-fold PLP-dependent enzyme [Burkholderiales bacterium]